jgi:hypothetical protein
MTKNEVRDNLFSAGFRYWVKINKNGCVPTRLVNRALHDSCHVKVWLLRYIRSL